MNQSSATKHRRSARRSLVAIAVGFAALVVAGGVAYASSPDAAGTIRNQTGPAGTKGATKGATSGTTTVPNDGAAHTLVTLDNGVALQGVCGPGTRNVEILLRDPTGGHHLQLWGTFTTDYVLTPTNGDNLPTAGPLPGGSEVDLSVVARNRAVGPFAHIDLHGASGPSCDFSWMAIPSSS